MVENNQIFEVLLIGDTGNVKRNKPDELLELLRHNLPTQNPSVTIFLGDNIYPIGLPDKEHYLRADAEMVLLRHQDALKDYNGKVLFISGNHDWNKGKNDGIEYVLRQQKYVEKLFKRDQIFIPSNGCPGPKEVPINNQLTIIAINTQWWIQKGYRPIGKQGGCNVNSEEDFFKELERLLKKNKDKNILVIGHYPIYSYSLHGGRYKFKHHLFPFTIYKKRAYLPLPLVGSLLPLYRKFFGAREDLSHPRFKVLRKRLKDIFRKHNNLIYAAGHEHNLQYIKKYNNHFIVSGAGSKSTYVLDGKYSEFGISAKGFFKLKFYPDKSVKAEVVIVDPKKNTGDLIYEGMIVDSLRDNNL